MGGHCLADRLGRHLRLSDRERTAVEQLADQERSYRRGSIILRQGDRAREMFVVHSGWLHSSVVLGNGSRQIMCFQFAGDLLGLSLLAFRDVPETLTAVTDVTLRPFSRERLGAVLGAHPRIGALLLALTEAGRVSLADRLASIGRTPARARVASLLCEIYMRLRQSGQAVDNHIHLPLTQEDIGDATGLTSVHVNRMMRGLVEDGVIERSGTQIRILDEKKLCAEASFIDRDDIDSGWLPGSA